MKIEFELQPKQKLFRESVETTPVTFFGGAKGGGKSHGLRAIVLERRFKYSNSHGAIFRKSYPDLEANHIRPLFQLYPSLRPYWNEQKKLLTLPNGSTLQFCYCSNEADLDNYQGREFHDLAIDEAGQWTEAMFRKLQGSNRSSKAGIKARTILTGNPGGIGHTWLKRLFIERRFNEREQATEYNFIQALVDDNPALIDNDPAYVQRLETETNEALRKAYRYGDWDIHAGQYFGEIRRNIHLIKPFAIPPHWNRFGAYDFGFNHPAAFGYFAVDEDGVVYLYREVIKAGMRVDQFAELLKQYKDTLELSPIVAGHDCWAKKGIVKSGSPPTIAEEFQNHDITITRAKIDRVNGANQLRSYLAWQGRPAEKPRFYIFETCPITYDCLTRMQHDPDNVEDVLKQDAAEGDPYSGDDAYDMVRYALMSRPMLTEPERPVYKPGQAGYEKQEIERMEEIALQSIKPREEEQWGDQGMGWE